MRVANPDDTLRDQVAALLAGGLATHSADRAYTSEAVRAVVAALQGIAPDDIAAKLVTAGFRAAPYQGGDVAQACQTCMYYQSHRRFCELPELRLPVEPHWSCILWRI